MSLRRRTFLNGITLGAGSTILPPMLGRLLAEAEGNLGQTPKRFLFFVEGNGLSPNHIQPRNIQRRKNAQSQNDADVFQDHSFGIEDLPPALEPLARFHDRMTVIQGLSGRVCGGGHSNNFGALGAYNGKAGAIGETIDAALGKALPGIFSSFNFGISTKPEHSVIYNCSAAGPGIKLPTQCRPDLAYNTLFGSIAQGDGAARFAAGQDLLDFLAEDVRRTRARIGSADREKLDSYLGAFENLRDRQARLVEVRDRLESVAPVPDDKFFSPVETDRLDAHCDLATAALVGGLTNVVTIASGVGDKHFGIKFEGLGIGLGKHGIGHGGSFGGMDSDELTIKIRKFHLGLLSRMLEQLDAVPEGDGTMLDHTVAIYLSDSAEAHHSRCWEWPCFVIGDLGGKRPLPRSGCLLNYPRYGNAGHRTMRNFYQSLLQAAGTPREDFGQKDIGLHDIDQDGPLQELLA